MPDLADPIAARGRALSQLCTKYSQYRAASHFRQRNWLYVFVTDSCVSKAADGRHQPRTGFNEGGEIRRVELNQLIGYVLNQVHDSFDRSDVLFVHYVDSPSLDDGSYVTWYDARHGGAGNFEFTAERAAQKQ